VIFLIFDLKERIDNRYITLPKPPIQPSLSRNQANSLPEGKVKTIALSEIKNYEKEFAEYHGDLFGLTKKAIQWHIDEDFRREHQAREREIEYLKQQKLFLDTKTALPPIDLPKDEHINFLSSVEEIFDEGEKMQHCVSSYAKMAVDGGLYIFHCTYKNAEATIAINPDGTVRQSRGPGNESNKASAYAEKILKKWGEGFPKPIISSE